MLSGVTGDFRERFALPEVVGHFVMVWTPHAVVPLICAPPLKHSPRMHLKLRLRGPFLPSDSKVSPVPGDKDKESTGAISYVPKRGNKANSARAQRELRRLKERVGITHPMFGEQLDEIEVRHAHVILDNCDMCVRFVLTPPIVNNDGFAVAGELGWLNEADHGFGRDRGPNFRRDLQSFRRAYDDSERARRGALSKARAGQTY